MKILIAQIIGYGSYGKALMLEELQAAIEENPGAEVYYLTCSNSFKTCYFNPLSKPEVCYLCKKGVSNSLKLINGSFKHLEIDELIQPIDLDIASSFVDNLDKVDFSLLFENFKVGESALSSYISKTRDRDLENIENSDFTKEIIKNGVSLYSSLKRYCEEESFDVIYNFNGRHIYNRAVMDVALALKIPLNNVEMPRVGGTIEHFLNVLPHSIVFKQKLYDEAWQDSKNSFPQKEEIASEYFNKRKSGSKVNATSFTENQLKNSLPETVDYSKSTVVLYTSSDDEFAAIGDEFSNPYFKDQNEGIFYVANLFHQKFPDKNLIIRIHPNFAGVKFKYANKLNSLKGKYKNVYLVEPESNIDSYALMDLADKIITFGSSITTESTYWGKPVIMLGRSFFSGMEIAYEPEKIEDLEVLLEKKDLIAKPKLGSLKFGYYLINGGKRSKYYNRDNKGNTYFKGRKLFFYNTWQRIITKIIKYSNQILGLRLFVK